MSFENPISFKTQEYKVWFGIPEGCCLSFRFLKGLSMDSESFGFPFEPYTIQKDFMKELYSVLSKGKVGIFESPTGTVGIRSLFSITLTLIVLT